MDKFFLILPTIISAFSGVLGVFLGRILQQYEDKRKSVMYPLDYGKLSKSRNRTTVLMATTLVVTIILGLTLFFFKHWYEFSILVIFIIATLWLFIEHLHDPTDGMPKIPSFEYNNEKVLVINTLTNNRILVAPSDAYSKKYYPSRAFVLNEDILLEKEITYTTISDIDKPDGTIISKVRDWFKKHFSRSK